MEKKNTLLSYKIPKQLINLVSLDAGKLLDPGASFNEVENEHVTHFQVKVKVVPVLNLL
jgi:hypothetical protein